MSRKLTRSGSFLIIALIMLTSTCYPLYSKVFSRVTFPQNYYSMKFYKGLDVNSWRGNLTIDQPITSKSIFRTNQELNLVLHHTPGFLRQWKLDEQLDFTFNRILSPEYSAILEGSWDRFIDQKAIPHEQVFRPNIYFPTIDLTNNSYSYYENESNISKYYFGIGGAVSLPKVITAEGSIGPIYENRRTTTRKGVRLRMKLDRFQSINGLSANGWMNKLNTGNDYGWKAGYTGEKQLTEEALNQTSIYYDQSKQYENLYGSESFGQRRDEQIQVANELASKVSDSFRVVWQSELHRHRSTHIRDESEKSDLDFGWTNQFELDLSGNKWQGVSYGGIDLQEQQYAGGLSQGRRKRVGLGVVYFPSILDSVSLRSLVIKYSYDTPDESDFNDRDELRYQIVFAFGKKITSDVDLLFKLESDLRHLVYVFRSRSGENRWHRVFRLAVEIPWKKQSFRNNAHYAVTSNYTDYDYQPAADNLSRIYRAFTISDTLSFDLSKHNSLEANFAALIDDHGGLQWSKWVQNLSEEGRGYTTTVVGTWNSENNLLKYGWNWHTRKTTLFLPNDVTTQGESTYSQGPIIMYRSNWGAKFQSDLTARWAYVIDRQRGNYRLPDVQYQLIWAL